MCGQISIAHEKSRLGIVLNVGILLFVVYLSFFILSAVCFAFLDLACRFDFIIHDDLLHVDWKSFFYNPLYVFDLYVNWWNTLVKSIRLMMWRPVLLVPFVVPVGMFVAAIVTLLTRNYSFSLWYILNHHFANIKDIKLMGLDKGLFMVLGRYAGALLSVKPADSVLCIGEMGSGKTSSVAIPSVLRSDNACIIGVDMTGLLPKYTAGYRAELGKVIYYNWDLTDDPEKEMYYPRWNPLDDDNMPKDRKEKDAYLKRIANYLIDVDDCEKDNYWNILANSLVVSFLGYWVAKVEQAKSNDYFLGKILEGKHLTKEEKDILLSHYVLMPSSYTKEIISAIQNDSLNENNYLPIGSWAGVPEQWIGRDVCFATITDWVLENYLSSTDDNIRDWKGWFDALLRETIFFGYGTSVESGIRQILALSAKQRQLVFACAIKPFKIFTNQAIRERTNGNDFYLDNIRGVYDENLGVWRPVTIYSMANTYASKILNQMFLDEALYQNLNLKENIGPLPVMLVLDDVGHNLRLKNLMELLQSGRSKKMSALLLCNSLALVENTYSKQELENVVVNTAYKIIKASDNQKLSRQLDKLAAFATRSVQIPKDKRKRKRDKRKYFADANYFHQLALDFKLRKNIKIDTKDHQIVLAEGYYHRPILADNVFFAEDDRFKKLAVMNADYTLAEDILDKKNKKYMETPKVTEIFNNKDLGLDDLVELEQYLNVVFEEFSDEVSSISEKKEETVKDIAVEKTDNATDKEVEDWWLSENAFNFELKTKTNPFGNKK